MRLTRKSYNRRIYAFGILIFIAISLISTGFATWVMSKNALDNQEGGVNIGTITDGSIKFGKVSFKNDVKDFLFEPAKGDTSGDIKWDVTTEVSENMSITLEGTVTPKDYFQSLTAQVTEIPSGVQKAIAKGYLVAPECYGSPVTVSTTVSGNDVAFSYKIEFKWGAFFEGQNPSINLDERVVEDEDGNPILDSNDQTKPYYTYEQKLGHIVDFRRTIFELPAPASEEEDTEETYTDKEVMNYVPSAGKTLKYKVVLTATANI